MPRHGIQQHYQFLRILLLLEMLDEQRIEILMVKHGIDVVSTLENGEEAMHLRRCVQHGATLRLFDLSPTPFQSAFDRRAKVLSTLRRPIDRRSDAVSIEVQGGKRIGRREIRMMDVIRIERVRATSSEKVQCVFRPHAAEHQPPERPVRHRRKKVTVELLQSTQCRQSDTPRENTGRDTHRRRCGWTIGRTLGQSSLK